MGRGEGERKGRATKSRGFARRAYGVGVRDANGRKVFNKDIACLNIIFCFSDFFFLVFNPGLLVARKEVELGVGRLHAIGMKVGVGDRLSISTIAPGFFL